MVQEYEVNTVKDLDYSVYKMRNGDVVTAEAILNRFINKLEIRGAVYRPGIYQLNGKLNTVRELVNEAQGLTGDAFLNRAVLYRQREDLTTEVVPVDIKVYHGRYFPKHHPDEKRHPLYSEYP